MLRSLRALYTTALAMGMFAVRMVLLGLMALLQMTLGGVDIEPERGRTDPGLAGN